MSHPAHVRAFQEYLEAVAEEDEMPSLRSRKMLLSYAELQFKVKGGSQCGICRAAVRHVLPVRIERVDGTHNDFKCLCTRCIEAEKRSARRVVLQIGEATIEHIARNAAKGEIRRAAHR